MLDGLHEVRLRAQQYSLANELGVILGGTHNYLQPGLHLAQTLQGLQPIHTRHLHVEQHNPGSATIAQSLEAFFATIGDFDSIMLKFEQQAKVPLHFRGILDQQDCGFRRSGFGTKHMGSEGIRFADSLNRNAKQHLLAGRRAEAIKSGQ